MSKRKPTHIGHIWYNWVNKKIEYIRVEYYKEGFPTTIIVYSNADQSKMKVGFTFRVESDLVSFVFNKIMKMDPVETILWFRDASKEDMDLARMEMSLSGERKYIYLA